MAVCSECVHKAVTHLGRVCEKRKAQLWVLSSVGVCVCLMRLYTDGRALVLMHFCVCVCTYSILMYSAAACLAERHILCCLATCNILPTDLLSEKQTACSLILLTSHICHFTSKTHWMPCCVSLFEMYLSLCEHLNFLFSPFFRSIARLVTVLVWIRLK